MIWLLYLLIGCFVGTLSGLLGIGGGVIVIPALSTLFIYYHLMPLSSVMHMTIGTSLAIVILTSLSGLYAYHKRAAVRWDVVKQIVWALLIGTLLGTLVADQLSSNVLQKLFGIFLLVIALKYLLARGEEKVSKGLSKKWMWFFSGLIGLMSSILGIGGGVLLMPFFLRCQLKIQEAAGTSLACGMVIGLTATMSFMFAGERIADVPWSMGYVYWPAFLGIAVMSVVMAPIGAKLALRLPTKVLRKVFAVVLIGVAGKMFFA